MRRTITLALSCCISVAVSAQELLPAVELTWQKPTQTDSGNALVVGGYEINYRAVDDDTVHRILITNPDRTALTIDNLQPVDYQFAMVAYDDAGCYGQFNQPQVMTIRQTERPQSVTMTVEQAQAPLPDPAESCDENCTIVSD